MIMLTMSIAYADSDKFFGKQSDEPMEITSDRMEAYNEIKQIVFSGNAMVKQGNKILKADKIILFYKKETEKKQKIRSIENETAGDLEKIEAKGNVSLDQGERLAKGDEAVYFRDSGKVVMTGNAVLSEGKNTIKGDRVIIFINEDRGIVESNTKTQVRAVLYPREKKKSGN